MAWITPKTDWTSADGVDFNDLNRIEGNVSLLGGAGTPQGVGTGDSPTFADATINGLRTKVVEIGDWDMDATNSINVAHGLTLNKIRAVNVTIRNDDDDIYYPIDFVVVPGTASQGTFSITVTDVGLARDPGGWFDGVDFDSTSYNRGWITIIYEA